MLKRNGVKISRKSDLNIYIFFSKIDQPKQLFELIINSFKSKIAAVFFWDSHITLKEIDILRRKEVKLKEVSLFSCGIEN
jgi:hypothetical protein